MKTNNGDPELPLDPPSPVSAPSIFPYFLNLASVGLGFSAVCHPHMLPNLCCIDRLVFNVSVKEVTEVHFNLAFSLDGGANQEDLLLCPSILDLVTDDYGGFHHLLVFDNASLHLDFPPLVRIFDKHYLYLWLNSHFDVPVSIMAYLSLSAPPQAAGESAVIPLSKK